MLEVFEMHSGGRNMVAIWVWGRRGKGETHGDFQVSNLKPRVYWCHFLNGEDWKTVF